MCQGLTSPWSRTLSYWTFVTPQTLQNSQCCSQNSKSCTRVVPSWHKWSESKNTKGWQSCIWTITTSPTCPNWNSVSLRRSSSRITCWRTLTNSLRSNSHVALSSPSRATRSLNYPYSKWKNSKRHISTPTSSRMSISLWTAICQTWNL